MSKIKNSGLDQYSTEPFEQQQFGTVGIEDVKLGTRIFYTTDQETDQAYSAALVAHTVQSS